MLFEFGFSKLIILKYMKTLYIFAILGFFLCAIGEIQEDATRRLDSPTTTPSLPDRELRRGGGSRGGSFRRRSSFRRSRIGNSGRRKRGGKGYRSYRTSYKSFSQSRGGFSKSSGSWSSKSWGKGSRRKWARGSISGNRRYRSYYGTNMYPVYYSNPYYDYMMYDMMASYYLSRNNYGRGYGVPSFIK